MMSPAKIMPLPLTIALLFSVATFHSALGVPPYPPESASSSSAAAAAPAASPANQAQSPGLCSTPHGDGPINPPVLNLIHDCDQMRGENPALFQMDSVE